MVDLRGQVIVHECLRKEQVSIHAVTSLLLAYDEIYVIDDDNFVMIHRSSVNILLEKMTIMKKMAADH